MIVNLQNQQSTNFSMNTYRLGFAFENHAYMLKSIDGAVAVIYSWGEIRMVDSIPWTSNV